MEEELKNRALIFTGSSMIAKGLIVRLDELGITPITVDDKDSALRNIFAINLNEQVRLFIRKDELEISKDVINTYLKEIEED